MQTWLFITTYKGYSQSLGIATDCKIDHRLCIIYCLNHEPASDVIWLEESGTLNLKDSVNQLSNVIDPATLTPTSVFNVGTHARVLFFLFTFHYFTIVHVTGYIY